MPNIRIIRMGLMFKYFIYIVCFGYKSLYCIVFTFPPNFGLRYDLFDLLLPHPLLPPSSVISSTLTWIVERSRFGTLFGPQ